MPALKDSQVFKVHGDSRWYGRLRQVTTVDVRDFVLTYLSVLYSHALEAPWITADSATRQEDIRTPSVKKDWFLNIIGFASNAGKYKLSLSLFQLLLRHSSYQLLPRQQLRYTGATHRGRVLMHRGAAVHGTNHSNDVLISIYQRRF